jgi:hypothetical protein
MRGWYWPLLLLANFPLSALVGRVVFGSIGAYMSALRSGIGLSARVWTMEDAEREEPTIRADFIANLILLIAVAAALAEHELFRRMGWR